MELITFALTKGRLAKQSMALLEQAGFCCDEMQSNSRKLIFTNNEQQLQFFLSKAQDVPTYVEYGAADLGICGKDVLLEENRSVIELLDLGIGCCKMAVAAKASVADHFYGHYNLRVATKYPRIAADFFNNQKGRTVEIIKLNGSVELGPMVSLSDAIVDIVETGATLKANGLVVVEPVVDISARLVANRVSMRLKYNRIATVMKCLREVVL